MPEFRGQTDIRPNGVPTYNIPNNTCLHSKGHISKLYPTRATIRVQHNCVYIVYIYTPAVPTTYYGRQIYIGSQQT